MIILESLSSVLQEATEITAINGDLSRDAENMPSGSEMQGPLSVPSEPCAISHQFILYGC